MKILHTSDWHLGQNFMGKSRVEEHEAFLSWLLNTIHTKQYALKLYYNFLKELSNIKTLITTMITTPNINMHIKTIYKDKELLENRTIQKYLIVQQEGKRKVKREVDHYNLDEVTIYTKTISKQLNLDLQKYNSQYKPIEIKKFKNSHDRFLILDDKEVYHIGASLKDLGKKWFAFSKMDMGSFDILNKLEK